MALTALAFNSGLHCFFVIDRQPTVEICCVQDLPLLRTNVQNSEYACLSRLPRSSLHVVIYPGAPKQLSSHNCHRTEAAVIKKMHRGPTCIASGKTRKPRMRVSGVIAADCDAM